MLHRMAQRSRQATRSCLPADRQRVERSGRDGSRKTGSAAYWEQRTRQALPGWSIEWLQPGPVQARLRRRRFGDAAVVEVVGPPLRLGRDAGAGGYQLVVQLSGDGHCELAGRTIRQRGGDLVLLDPDAPYEATYPCGCHVLIWHLPRALLQPSLADFGIAGHRHLRGKEACVALLRHFAHTLSRTMTRLDPALHNSLLIHLCGLTGLALAPAASPGAVTQKIDRAARRQQLLEYMERHLRDSHLTPERAAHDLGISRRWLHGLLEHSGASFSRWVTARRLQECSRMLVDRRYDHWSIARIALACGFNDLSTFYRHFREHHHVTPREIRHQARGGEFRDHLPVPATRRRMIAAASRAHSE
jgi:AraC family transcriptional regulator, positive regulator of tynA and feaB